MAVLEATKDISRRMLQELDDFVSEIENVHMVWLKEIEQEAYRMFSGESNTEPELMPKTPSQKRRPRKKRISMTLQEEARTRRRFSKGRRSNLAAASSVSKLQLVLEEPQTSTSSVGTMEPQASTSMEPQASTTMEPQASTSLEPQTSTSSVGTMEPQASTSLEPQTSTSLEPQNSPTAPVAGEEQPPPLTVTVKAEPVEEAVDMSEPGRCAVLVAAATLPKATVRLSAGDRRSAEAAMTAAEPESSSSSPDGAAGGAASPGATASPVSHTTGASVAMPTSVATPTRPRVSLALRHSAAGLRHSLTREAVRRASRRSLMKKVAAHASNSTCSEDRPAETEEEEEEEEEDEHQPEEQSEPAEVFTETQQPEVTASSSSKGATRASRSAAAAAAANSRSHAADTAAVVQSPVRPSRSAKRKPEEHADISSHKKVVRPNMRTFLQSVQRNQVLMTPNSVGRPAVIKSFIKHSTPLKVDMVAKERQKLEVLKKKQEQEEERMNKIEEDKKRKQEELKRKREERLKKAAEARAKEEQKAEEKKKKKMEQKRVQMEKEDKLRAERLAEEKVKKQQALKHQEEIDSRRKLEEETRLKKIQQAEEEEEKRQQALQAKRRAEEESHRAQKLAEARRAQELKKEQERLERERAEALQREEAEEKERKEAEKKALEDKMKEEQQRLAEEERAANQRLAEEERAANQRLAEAAAKMQHLGQSAAGLNVTMDVESSLMKSPPGNAGPAGLNATMDVPQSPQTYIITPKGGNKTVKLTGNPDDYGMDQNSDDSTDDESAPRKPIPSWATGQALQQTLLKEYFNPPDLHGLFGSIAAPNLEEIFYTKKPRFNKRTSSAVWHSPPMEK